VNRGKKAHGKKTQKINKIKIKKDGMASAVAHWAGLINMNGG